MTRREFLRGAAFAAAASMLPQTRRVLASEARNETPSAAGAASISGLANRIRGRVILPSDPGYDSARRVFSWNPTNDKHPALLVRCAGRDDVRAAIEYARRANLEVAIRGGGHDVLGKSVCEGGMVIDLTPMKRIAIDPKKRVARVEAGVTSGELNAAAGKYNLAVALGCNQLVGVSGLTLGGGLGMAARQARRGLRQSEVDRSDWCRCAESSRKSRREPGPVLGVARWRRKFRSRHQLRIRDASA